MDAIANLLGLTIQDLTTLIALGLILVVAWFALRVTMKLTASLFRAGCITILLILGAVFLLFVVN